MRRTGIKILIFLILIITLVSATVACNKDKVKVSFLIDGQVYYSAETSSGSSLGALPAAPTMNGYRFDGWYLDKDVWTQPFTETTKVIDDISVYAHFLIDTSPNETCRVTFDSRGGSTVGAVTLTKGAALTLPAPPTRTGYDFAGWYYDLTFETQFLSGTAIVRDITLYAKWNTLAAENYFNAENGVLVSLTEAGKGLSEITLPLKLNGSDITAVGNGLFENQENLTSVTIPMGYVSIGDNAFKGCKALEKVNFSNSIASIGVSAFEGCEALLNVQLPTALEKVSQNSFKDCKNLKNVTWTNVTEIGDGAFYNANSLRTVNIPESVVKIGNDAFRNAYAAESLVLREGIRSIGEYAFYNCRKISSVTIPNSVESIGKSAFYNIWAAKSVTVGTSVTEIADNAFREARACENLVINGEVSSIGAYAFSGMVKLSSLSIPESVLSIGEGAFSNAKLIKSVVLPSGVSRLEKQVFSGCSALESIDLESVSFIGESAFYNCSALNSVSFGDNAVLTKVGASAFENCTSIENISFPSCLTEIGERAFRGCTKLKAFTAPESLETLGSEAFYGCRALTTVVLNGALTSLGGSAFSGCTALTDITVVSGGAFTSDSGVLLSSGGQVLTLYPAAKTDKVYSVPSGVVSIASGAFSDNDFVTEVELPDGLSEIYSDAFKGCKSLSSVNFPSSLKSIGKNAFYDTALETADLPLGLREIGDRAFGATGKLTYAYVPAGTVSVGSEIFYYSSSEIDIVMDFKPLTGWSSHWLDSGMSGVEYNYRISSKNSADGYEYVSKDGFAALTKYTGSETEVIIPESIGGLTVTVLAGTFENNDSVISVSVPDSVLTITELTFAKTSSLEKLSVPFVGAYRNAKGAFALAGYVFDYSESRYAGWTEQTAGTNLSYFADIPDTLSEIVVTESIAIYYGAFSGMNKLGKITFSGISAVGVSAFRGCGSLQEIVTGMTEAQWNDISKGTDWNKNTPSGMKITFTDSVSDTSGGEN